MESNDSEVLECLNWLRPPVRRDYTTNRSIYSKNFSSQQHRVNFLSEWRTPKKRNPCCNRLRREVESSTSFVLQKKATEQIFDNTSGVVSYTCLPNTRIEKTTRYQVTSKVNLKKPPKKKDDIPVIQVIVIPTEEREVQLQKHKVPKIDNNCKSVYLVVAGKNNDKVYEIQTTDTATVAEEVHEDDVGHVFNGCFKQIVKSITMEKKHKTGGNKYDVTEEHVCACYSLCDTQGTKSCEDKPPHYQPPPCKPCPPQHKIPLQESPPLVVRAGRNKVTIHGKLGINEEDRFVMKCGACIDDKPVIPEFLHVGVKASTNRETVHEWDSNEKYSPDKTKSLKPRTKDKDTQCSCKCTTKEIPSKSAVEDDQSPVVVVSVFPKDRDGISELIPLKQHVSHDRRPVINKNDDNNFYITPPQKVNNFTQDSQAQLLSSDVPRRPMPLSNVYNDEPIPSMRPGRPREASYNTDGRDRSPNGRRWFYDYNDVAEMTSKLKTNDLNLDHVRKPKLSEEVARQVMGLNFNEAQILVTHSIVEPRITRSNYTQSNENEIMRNINIKIENNTTRNMSTQNDLEYNKEQRCNKVQVDNKRFSPDRYQQTRVPNMTILRTCVNETCCKECIDQMIQDYNKVNEKREPKNKNVNNKIVRSPNRSPSPPSKHQRNTGKEKTETNLVKRNRSKSPRTTNISPNREQKNVSSNNKTKNSAAMSRSALNTKRPKSKTKDKTNNLNKSKSKTVTTDNYKKKVNDRVDEYYRMSPRHDVSKISVNIDSENEYYDVSFHKRLNTTGITVCKTLKEKRKTGSLQNLLCKSKTQCAVENAPDIPLDDDNLFESNSRFHVRDSLELSHRHSLKTEGETQTKAHTHFSVSNNDLTNFAPIKHFTGDNCTICDPIERDKEIRELLGIPRRISSSKTNHSKTQNVFEDRKYVTKLSFDDRNRKTVTVNCSVNPCCYSNKGEGDSVKAKTKKSHKEKKSPKHSDKNKKNFDRSNLYQQLILNRNVQVFLEVEQFNKQKPICLSKKQYNKVKKVIKSTLSKNRHLLEKRKKPAVEGGKCECSPCKAIADQHEVICISHCKVDCATKCIKPPLLARSECSFENISCSILANRITHVLEETSQDYKKLNKTENIHSDEIMKKNSSTQIERTDRFDLLNTLSMCFSFDDVDPKNKHCMCCKSIKTPSAKHSPVEEKRRDFTKQFNKKPKDENLVDTARCHNCPCIQSLVSLGEVRVKTTRVPNDDTYNNMLGQNNQGLEEFSLLEEQDVEQKMEILEDLNVDLNEVVDDSDDEYVDPLITEPCEKTWLKYKRFQKLKEEEEKIDTVILYKREKPHDIDARQTMSSMEVRYTNVAYVKEVKYSSMDVADSLVSDSSLALKDPVSIETLFKGHTKSQTPNLGTSTMSCISDPSCPETPPSQKPAKKPFLRRLMSCLVMRSEKTPGPNLQQPKYRLPSAGSSLDSYHFDTLGAIDITSSLYDTSASFYTNHSIQTQYTKMSKRGFLSSVRGFLYRRI